MAERRFVQSPVTEGANTRSGLRTPIYKGDYRRELLAEGLREIGISHILELLDTAELSQRSVRNRLRDRMFFRFNLGIIAFIEDTTIFGSNSIDSEDEKTIDPMPIDIEATGCKTKVIN